MGSVQASAKLRITEASDEKILPANQVFYQSSAIEPYVVMFTLNPVDQVPIWISHIQSCFGMHGITLVYRHPLQVLPAEFFGNSLGVLLWNGTLPIFDTLKAFLDENSIKYSYVECGFFPQTDHVYFDRQGINVDCSLANDDLSWLPSNINEIIHEKSEVFFKDVPIYRQHEAYIFVPLQLAHDSNIQLHSRFVNGMQAFVDYIESQYPNEVIVFKAHPRDPNHYKSASSKSYWSNACARSLIKGAKKVHGINSSVLFEAQLYGAETVIEGDCLLTRHNAHRDKILAAIILWQFELASASTPANRRNQQRLSLAKISQRSHLRLHALL